MAGFFPILRLRRRIAFCKNLRALCVLRKSCVFEELEGFLAVLNYRGLDAVWQFDCSLFFAASLSKVLILSWLQLSYC